MYHIGIIYGGESLKVRKVQKKSGEIIRKKEHKHHHEISGILILALGVLMLLSFYFVNSIGLFGDFIRDVSLGLFGFPAFLMPPALIAFAIYLIINRNNMDLKNTLIFSFILFALVSSVIQSMLYRSEDYNNLPPLKCVEKLYLDGAGLTGGGVLGGIISIPLLLVFQKLGTMIILTALALVDIILLTNASIANFLLNLKSLFFQKNRNAHENNAADVLDDGPEIIEKDDK
ncbi:MAG: DNA translocase FtsK, partial [Ruminiclostridium sp.]|nr:DNA translocase FtsK [Ruminiclostridium sp.]